jgi:ferredoxin
MWTKMMSAAQKGPKTIAVIDPDQCFARLRTRFVRLLSCCRLHRRRAGSRRPDGLRGAADLCIGCGLCVTLGNPTAPQQRESAARPIDAINMMPWKRS